MPVVVIIALLATQQGCWVSRRENQNCAAPSFTRVITIEKRYLTLYIAERPIRIYVTVPLLYSYVCNKIKCLTICCSVLSMEFVREITYYY